MNARMRYVAIALVMSAGPAEAALNLQAARQIQAELILEVPSAGDTILFLQRPVGATRFDNGAIAVVDGLAQTIRFFDSEGVYSGSAGRSGEGPNEFSTPGWIGRCGPETAMVWDFSLMRFTTVDGSGAIISQRPMAEIIDVPRPPARLACSRTGHLLALLRLGGERTEGRTVSVMTAPLYGLRRGGDPVLMDPAVRVIEWINAESTYRPVSPTTHFAVSDSLIFLAPSDSLLVRVHDLDGRFRRAWPLDLPRREPTEDHVRQSAGEVTAHVSSSAARRSIVGQFMALPRPEFLPYHGGIRVDPLGRVWIIASIPGDPDTILQAYTADGRFLGEVGVPAALEVYEVGPDHVLGAAEDPQTLEPRVLLFGFDLGR